MNSTCSQKCDQQRESTRKSLKAVFHHVWLTFLIIPNCYLSSLPDVCLYVCLQQEHRLFTVFHRQVFCLTDKWHGMTMEDIRAIEDQTQKELNEVSWWINLWHLNYTFRIYYQLVLLSTVRSTKKELIGTMKICSL